MKLTVNRAALQDALILANTVVPARSPKPILSCVALSASGGKLTVSATDLERRVSAEVEQVQIEREGTIAVSHDKLTQIVRAAEAETLVLDLEKDQLHVRCDDSHYKLFTEDASGFPAEQIVGDESVKFDIAAGTLAKLLNRVDFACAVDSSRYAFSGVLLVAEDSKPIHCAATDGRRLSLASTTDAYRVGKSIRAIIPAPAVKSILAMDADPESMVSVTLSPNCAVFSVEHVRLTTVLLEGQFPPYEDVIPKDCDKKMTLSGEVFAGALRRAALMTNEQSSGVRFAFDKKGVVLTSRSPESGEATVTVPCKYEGADMEIGFNPAYLLEAVKVMDAEELTLEMTAANRPGLLRGGKEHCVVTMPVNLN